MKDSDKEEDIAAAAEAVQTLDKRLALTPGVPTTTGAARASLAHKVHCVIHSGKLTSRSWRDCACRLESVVCWTGDLGTEAKIAGVRANLTELFGPWVRQSDEGVSLAEAGRTKAGCSQAPAEGPLELDFQGEENSISDEDGSEYHVNIARACFIPGVLHVIHDMTEDLKNALFGWQAFVVNFKHITRMLRRPQPLLATCFAQAPFTEVSHRFASFESTVYEGRWAETLKAARELEPLEDDLRAAWHLGRYTFHQPLERNRLDAAQGQEQLADADFGVKLQVVDESIRSDHFWAFLALVVILGDTLFECQQWAERRPCHDDFGACIRSHYTRRRRFMDKYRVMASGCPMRTRRAPEMADFALNKLMRRLLNHVNISLVLHPNSRLTEEEKTHILREFRRARGHLLMSFNVKFAHWGQLPWVAYGLGHTDKTVAMSCATYSHAAALHHRPARSEGTPAGRLTVRSCIDDPRRSARVHEGCAGDWALRRLNESRRRLGLHPDRRAVRGVLACSCQEEPHRRAALLRGALGLARGAKPIGAHAGGGPGLDQPIRGVLPHGQEPSPRAGGDGLVAPPVCRSQLGEACWCTPGLG